MTSRVRRDLRIAHICFSALPATIGGMETIVDSLIKCQMDDGHHVALITRWNQAKALRKSPPAYPVHRLLPRPKPRSAPYLDVGSRWPIMLAIAAHQIRHQFDVWHAHWVYPTGWMAQGALRTLKVPLVMTAHGADINVDANTNYGFRQHAVHDARIRSLLAGPAHVTAVSPELRATLEGLGAKDAHFIPNGIAASGIQTFSADKQMVRANLGVPDGAALLLTVARNQPSKGLHHIPEVLQILKSNGHRMVWAIVGPGSQDLAQMFEDAGLSNDVRLIPPIKKSHKDLSLAPPSGLIELYQSADVFVFPSHSEAFGLVALEAMAAGTPTVASDISGLRSFIQSGENGSLVPVGRPIEMANAVKKLLSDPELYMKIVNNGLETAKQFSWDRIAGRYTDLYYQVVDARL